MPRTNPPYPPEFRREATRLVRSAPEERPISEIAREPGIPAEALRNWVKQEEIDAGEREGLTTEEREELRRLRRENKVHAELRALGIRCGRKRVARPMRKLGIRGCLRGRKRRTTRRDRNAVPAPDLVNRNFAQAR